jgi:gluconate 2-dehydrogenase gamma chain
MPSCVPWWCLWWSLTPADTGIKLPRIILIDGVYDMKKQSPSKHDSSRRSFLAGAATGLGSAWIASNWSSILEAQEHAKRALASGGRGKLEFFSEEQAIEVESVAAQIIPTDDTPGAREAGAVYFIDRALTTFDREHQPVYTQGLTDLQAKTRELFPGATKFSELSPDQQIQVLKTVEKISFFAQIRTHTITGFLANPEYGGNRDEIGWKLIGFEDKFHFQPPFGYYDAEGNAAAATKKG